MLRRGASRSVTDSVKGHRHTVAGKLKKKRSPLQGYRDRGVCNEKRRTNGARARRVRLSAFFRHVPGTFPLSGIPAGTRYVVTLCDLCVYCPQTAGDVRLSSLARSPSSSAICTRRPFGRAKSICRQPRKIRAQMCARIKINNNSDKNTMSSRGLR